jgi:hypothetical protein
MLHLAVVMASKKVQNSVMMEIQMMPTLVIISVRQVRLVVVADILLVVRVFLRLLAIHVIIVAM